MSNHTLPGSHFFPLLALGELELGAEGLDSTHVYIGMHHLDWTGAPKKGQLAIFIRTCFNVTAAWLYSFIPVCDKTRGVGGNM